MNEASLSSLYERCGYLVFKRCVRLLGNAADAEDAMQDVFIRAHASSVPATSPLVWLYRVATNCCFDRLRRQRLVDQQRTPAAEPFLDIDPDRRALLGLVLRQVDPLVCEMGLLHHLDGLTQEEIAHECGISRKTVGKKLELFQLEFVERWRHAEGP